MNNIAFNASNDKVLGFNDLLPKIPPNLCLKLATKGQLLDQDEVALLTKINSAAENASSPLLFGISAIGELLAQSHEEVSPDAIHNIGWLLESLGKQAEYLLFLQRDCSSMLAKHSVLQTQV